MLSTDPGCELDVERGPDWLLVTVRNVCEDLYEPLPLADQLWSLMEQHFTYRVVLELDQVPVLNSYLVGQLVLLHRRVEERGGTLRLCGLSPYNRQVLRTCRLGEFFPPFQTRQEAVMGCCRLRRPR